MAVLAVVAVMAVVHACKCWVILCLLSCMSNWEESGWVSVTFGGSAMLLWVVVVCGVVIRCRA